MSYMTYMSRILAKPSLSARPGLAALQRQQPAFKELVVALCVAACPSDAMPAPYSVDLAEKMVVKHFWLEQPTGLIAEHLCVDPRTVERRITLFEAGEPIRERPAHSMSTGSILLSYQTRCWLSLAETRQSIWRSCRRR